MTKKIAVQEADANLQKIMSLVREGTEIILMQGDIPPAHLAPADTKNPGFHPSGWMSDDFTVFSLDYFWLCGRARSN